MKKGSELLTLFFALFLFAGISSAQSDYSLEQVGEFGGWDDAGIITHGMIQYDNYLYAIDNEDLAIYEINSDPTSPTLVNSINVPGANKIFLVGEYFDDILVTTENNGTFGFIKFSLSDPLNPLEVPAAEVPGSILSIAVGSGTFANVAVDNTDSLYVYYIGLNTEAPYLVDVYPLPGNGVCLSYDSVTHLLFVGYAGNSNGILVYSTSNPFDYEIKSDFDLNSNYPQSITHRYADDKLFAGLNNSGTSSLACYDYSNPDNFSLIAERQVSDQNELWDVEWTGDLLSVSINNGGELKTYLWDDVLNVFSVGPEAVVEEPADIISYFHPTAKKNAKDNLGEGTEYIYVLNGEASGTSVNADGKTQIFKIFPPGGGGEKVTLTMNINPPEAADNGCSTTPSPGEHQYDRDTEINLYALPNMDNGWYFTGWSGNASGTDLIYHIILNEDKYVTANFEPLQLTVSGKRDWEFHCPTEINEKESFLMFPITACASEVDDWTLNGISLHTSGSGNEKTDVAKVDFYMGESVIYSGTFLSDDGILNAFFNPPIQIGAGECVTLYVKYTFNFDPETYCDEQIKSFHVETFAPVAEPVNYEDGVIVGSARNTDFVFGKVYNKNANAAFLSIQDGIDVATENDICYVCPGTYDYPISIWNKNSLTLKSISGKNNTILSYGDELLSINLSQKITIDGFTFDLSIYYEVRTGISVYHCQDVVLKNNLLFSEPDSWKEGINVIESKELKISNSEISNFRNAIKLISCSDFEISSNTLSKNSIGISLTECNYASSERSYISNNKISFSRSVGIDIDKSKTISLFQNSVSDSKCALNYGGVVVDNSDHISILYNDIYRNGQSTFLEYAGIYLKASNSIRVAKNSIHNNTVFGIRADNSSRILIKLNKIWGHKNPRFISGLINSSGVFFQNVSNSTIYCNKIFKNCSGIEQISTRKIYIKGNYIVDGYCSNTGINLSDSESGNEIIGNNIINNEGNGILCEQNSQPLIENNNIYGNSEFGVNNDDASVTLFAGDNYWGNPNGPGENDINGNITANTWLSEPVALVVFPVEDTIFVSASEVDSTQLLIQNLSTPNDAALISVSDNKGWIEAIENETIQLPSDSSAVGKEIFYEIPSDVSIGDISTVTYNASSTGKRDVNEEGRFYLVTYQPVVAEIKIAPDSLTTAYGDTISFYAAAYDQYKNGIDFTPVWTTNHGDISSEGVFLPGDYEGEIEITATDDASGISTTAFVYNTNQALTLSKVTISPSVYSLQPEDVVYFEANGWNQFNYPYEFEEVWSATGGTINEYGIYTAGTTPGNYEVSVTDANGAVVATAEITIEEPNGIDDENATPESYSLKQNFPNPFNPTTTIEYSLPYASKVTVEIFNILGERIVKLVDAVQNGGYKSIIWNASKNASGVYIVRIRAVSVENGMTFTDHKKMILLK